MKKAILAASYGTTYPEAILSSVQEIEDTFRRTAPDFDVFRAFTGKRVISMLKQKGIFVDSLEGALRKLAEERYNIVVVQPTHIMHGTEYMTLQKTVFNFQGQFQKIILGVPLLNTSDDIERFLRVILKKFSSVADVLLLAGHGSSTENSGSLYTDITHICRKSDYTNVYAAAIDTSPKLEDILPVLKNAGYHSVAIIPVMVTAGKHICRDLMGDGAGSWKYILEREGFEVIAITQGLGEYEEVRTLYSDHLKMLL